ncbi:hypothetical protein EXIGLDRAFT_698801 [Exidia glandulosa HHB12029]|uniref:Uncharacterized protein n=1 Tax=Exidia glandulosa HHB12029 TaxID=1314781 RepID=A0A165E3C8_EXIGL|nr:hypothetical protein EXIGLDRAFT_698801 [Exidia glandulosa HHB12029]
MSRRQSSARVSNGLAATTVALKIAGAATDAVPIAKQILNSAAHICAAAEGIQKKREGMYLLVEKADLYATQIDQAVAECEIDTSLQRRLGRLYSYGFVFHKIEALVNDEVESKSPALVRVWRNIITKPNRAETLLAELDREIELFHILNGIQQSADSKYDGQFRRLRDCDIEKLDVIKRRETDEGVVVWASARVKRQLMVIRYLESQPKAQTNVAQGASQSWAAYLENIKKVSSMVAILRGLNWYSDQDASSHLEDVHGLTWVGEAAVVDENGEPRIGLFDDIVRADSSPRVPVVWRVFLSFNCRYSTETGIVQQAQESSLHAIVTEQLRDGRDTDRLARVWDTIRREQLHVMYSKRAFPVVSGNPSLPQELIARAQLYFESNAKKDDPYWNCIAPFVRYALAGGGGNVSSRICIFMRRDGDKYMIEVETCTHDDSHAQYESFLIDIPAGTPLLAEVALAAGLPDGFERSWDGSDVFIYPHFGDEGDSAACGSEKEEEDDGALWNGKSSA